MMTSSSPRASGGAWERAIHKEEYISSPGEYIAEVPINVIGKRS